MGRNEIRLRRHMMSSGRIAQHRNYRDIMARHERDLRWKRVIRVFIYFLVIVFFLIIYFMVKYWEEKKVPRSVSQLSGLTSEHLKKSGTDSFYHISKIQ